MKKSYIAPDAEITLFETTEDLMDDGADHEISDPFNNPTQQSMDNYYKYGGDPTGAKQ